MSNNWTVNILCPLLGAIICNIMWLTPFNSVQVAYKSMEIGNLNPIPYSITFFNCIGWTLFGFLITDYFLFFANVPGLILSLYYSTTSINVISRTLGRTTSSKNEENENEKHENEKHENENPRNLENEIKLITYILSGSILFWSVLSLIGFIGFKNYEIGKAIICNLII